MAERFHVCCRWSTWGQAVGGGSELFWTGSTLRSSLWVSWGWGGLLSGHRLRDPKNRCTYFCFLSSANPPTSSSSPSPGSGSVMNSPYSPANDCLWSAASDLCSSSTSQLWFLSLSSLLRRLLASFCSFCLHLSLRFSPPDELTLPFDLFFLFSSREWRVSVLLT